MIVLNAELLAMLGGVVVPVLVALVTKLNASAGIKATINALLTIVAGAVATIVAQSGAFNWKITAFNVALAWAISIATYYGFWKPTGTTAALAVRTATFGIGRSAPPIAAV